MQIGGGGGAFIEVRISVPQPGTPDRQPEKNKNSSVNSGNKKQTTIGNM